MSGRSELSCDSILAERLVRQRLAAPLPSRKGLVELIRALQPLSTGPQARPGSPPRLLLRRLRMLVFVVHLTVPRVDWRSLPLR